MGDRTTAHDGATGKPVKVVYDAEIRDLLYCEKLYNSCCCIKYNATRSYIWLLDGAIEMKCATQKNHAVSSHAPSPMLPSSLTNAPFVSRARSDGNRTKCPCTPGFCVPLQDDISKFYFDKKPFRPYGYCGGKCCYKEPKLEVMHGGCMFCCVHINPGPPCFPPKESVVLMPYERGSFPCCCVANRVNFNENCCGCCGPPTGDPKLYEMLPMQPKNAAAFVAEAKKQLVGRNAPGMMELERQDI